MRFPAKKIAKSLGLPIVSGSGTGIKEVSEAIKISKQIGFPVLIKAAGGGVGIVTGKQIGRAHV